MDFLLTMHSNWSEGLSMLQKPSRAMFLVFDHSHPLCSCPPFFSFCSLSAFLTDFMNVLSKLSGEF